MLCSIVHSAVLVGYIIHTLNVTKNIMLGVVVMILRYQWELNKVFQDLSVNYSEIVRMDADIQSIQPILDGIKKLTSLPKIIEINQYLHTI